MSDADPSPRLTRRGLLGGMVAGLGVATTGPVAPASAAGERPVSMAMHVHAVYSEGPGSMQAHLHEATRAGIDVVWWTDHDSRMLAHRYRNAVRFDGPTEDEDGQTWTWTQVEAAAPTGVKVAWVAAPTSGRDAGGRALRMTATGTKAAYSTVRMVGSADRDQFVTGIGDQSLELDVLARSVGPDAYVELSIGLSYRPATGGRPAGRYRLAYRIGGDARVGSAVADGLDGVVTVASVAEGWTRLRTAMIPDLLRLWPDLVAGDNATVAVDLVVGARRGATVDVVVDALRFFRSARRSDLVLARRAQIAAALAPRYPKVVQYGGVELSLYRNHANWFGSGLVLPDVSGLPVGGDETPEAMGHAVDHVRGHGGVASYNHPFGSGSRALLPAATRARKRRAVAAELVAARCYGADVLEVGYPLRNGMGLGDHVALWDTLSARGVFLTGTGVTDDHTGQSWLDRTNNYVTWVWAGSRSIGDLTAALAAGRAWFGNPNAFRGVLDLVVDGTVAMGAVSAAKVARRAVRVIATDLPAGGRLELVRGVVDRLASPTDPVTEVVLDLAPPKVGFAEVAVDTRTECFVRPVVRDAAGQVVALGNPVWLLRSLPAGVPQQRRA